MNLKIMEDEVAEIHERFKDGIFTDDDFDRLNELYAIDRFLNGAMKSDRKHEIFRKAGISTKKPKRVDHRVRVFAVRGRGEKVEYR